MRERQKREEEEEEAEEGWCRLQGEMEKRGGAGGEQFTLFSDQRTEYRLERQKKERKTENKE